MVSDVVEDEQGGEHEGVGEYEENHDETEEYELLNLFRSLPDNDGAGAAKQHAKGEECAAQPGMLSDVVEDEEGGEHDDEGEHLKSREGTEESELSPVVRHPEERSTFQKILKYSIKGLGTWIDEKFGNVLSFRLSCQH